MHREARVLESMDIKEESSVMVSLSCISNAKLGILPDRESRRSASKVLTDRFFKSHVLIRVRLAESESCVEICIIASTHPEQLDSGYRIMASSALFAIWSLNATEGYIARAGSHELTAGIDCVLSMASRIEFTASTPRGCSICSPWFGFSMLPKTIESTELDFSIAANDPCMVRPANKA